MSYSFFHTTSIGPGQSAKWPLTIAAWALMLLNLNSCHRVPTPFDCDPQRPGKYACPAQTFRTWVAASLAGDAQALTDCYWGGMPPHELRAWVTENLRPEARDFFHNAKLTEIQPATRVEINFTFLAGNGEEARGVMVRTRQGWKIQSW